MLVSVCMASYDRAPEILDKVLASIFRQRPPFEFEVVLCDDGSPTGDTRKVCQRYPVQYHRIEREPGYRNPAMARNVTYRAAKGDIIICQSDDVVHTQEDTIERLVQELKDHVGVFAVATVCACSPEGKPWSEYTGLNRRVPYLFLGAVWRADLYAVGGNDEDFQRPTWDDEWFAQCLINGLGLTPHYTNRAIGHHLYHINQATRGDVKHNRAINDRKKRSGTWCASGGPWPCDAARPNETERVFTKAYKNRDWGEHDSLSGQGSTIAATRSIREMLPRVFHQYRMQAVLDIPCGDFAWMQHVNFDGVFYIGADVVQSLVAENARQYPRDFRHLDLLTSDLPEVDLVLCRDCLGHLSLADCRRALDNIKRSGSKYLLTTTFFHHENRDLRTGSNWAPRSMCRAPFNLPPPLLVIDELCRESHPAFQDKSLALWKTSSL